MKKNFIFISCFSLLITAIVGNVKPVNASSMFLDARDFSNIIVSGNPTPPQDFWNGFTWWDRNGTGEVETYGQANSVFTSIRQDINPTVSITANAPVDTYRMWIYQLDESWDRSLETTIGSDTPIITTFDFNAVGSFWTWLDLGIHNVGNDTTISVSAVGDYAFHGAPVRERRGGFSTIFLTTDLTSVAPSFVPTGQSASVPEPTTFILIGMGFIGLICSRLRIKGIS